MSRKVPSPCIGVCKFKDAGHCICCGQTRKQKKSFKKLGGRKKRLRFLIALTVQQAQIGGRAKWLKLYRRRCKKKGLPCPFDDGSIPSFERQM